MPAILIVDDSPISRKILRRVLPPGAHDIRECSSGQECLEMYQAVRPDLVFLDLTMPGLDGFQTLELLKRLDPSAQVIVVTADVQSGSRARVLALGAVDIIAKPPSSSAVEAAMKLIPPC